MKDRMVKYDDHTRLRLTITPVRDKDMFLVQADKLMAIKVGALEHPVYKIAFKDILHRSQINSFLETAAQVGFPDWSPKEFS